MALLVNTEIPLDSSFEISHEERTNENKCIQIVSPESSLVFGRNVYLGELSIVMGSLRGVYVTGVGVWKSPMRGGRDC